MFIHLHNHSHYSLLDGLSKIDDLVKHAKTEGAPAIALTDHGVLYGAIEFYQKCKQAGIKAIIGCEVYLAPNSRHDKQTREDARSFHLVLLAKNNQGYNNLIKLVSIAHLEGFYYKPRVDWELLKEYHQGIIALSACLGGEIPKLILSGNLEQAKTRILEYQELFGVDNYYLELMDHPELDGQDKVNQILIKFSQELGVPLVATNDSHYVKPEDAEAQDILLCIQNKKKIEDADRMKMIGFGDYSLRPSSEMKRVFAHVPEAITNTVKIAEACNLEITLGEIQLPSFEVPPNFTGDSYLRHLCEAGLFKKYGLIKKANDYQLKDGIKEIINSLTKDQIIERLDYELAVITKMGWSSYFIIVADFVNWAKDNKIVVGPGRGSAAGSLVCYLTGITNLDPLQYDLLFERFLNPDRVSMPDIDMDFADSRRADVLNYVAEKYGYDHVAQIITFGTMAARAAVRDVGRVLGISYDYCDKISKSIPMFYTLDKAIKEVPELKEIYQNEAEAKKVLDYARRLEGVARHTSTHACGVLITPKPLTEYVPIQYASSSDKTIISQYSLHPVEDLGLLKMDFLGLKNLSIMESALKIIKKTRGIEIDIDNLPLDDELSYQLFQKAETTGVFQFESSGMKRYLRELKPNQFEDIIAMVALYRPGPMEWIPDYIKNKHDKRLIKYIHPKLEPILSRTYGVAIYQEQVMQIARSLAGFTPGDADILRKAMGKKIASLLAEQKVKFIEGCVKNSIHEDLAKQVFAFIEPFAGYGFNRSHAACYAMIGYQTAYLKAHWPVEFMAALLSADQHDNDRIAIEIEECRAMGIKVMAPDINESFDSFTVVTPGTKENQAVSVNTKVNTIRFGLKAIKNVGDNIVDVIIDKRKKQGPYKNIFDFLERINNKDLNKKSLESLIKSGAFEAFSDRSSLLYNLDKLLNYNKSISKQEASGQVSLFANSAELSKLSKPSLDLAPDISEIDKLSWEKDLLGLYISGNPLSVFKKELANYSLPLANLKGYRGNNYLIIAGVITSLKKIITRKGETMAFVKIEDVSANIELLVFPRTYRENLEIWQNTNIIMVRGRLSEKDHEHKFLVDSVALLNPNQAQASVDAFKKSVLEIKSTKHWQKRDDDSLGGHKIISGSKDRADISKVIPLDNEPALRIAFKISPGEEEQEAIKAIIEQQEGNQAVYFRIVEANKDHIIKTAMRVDNTKELRESLAELLKDKAQIVEPD